MNDMKGIDFLRVKESMPFMSEQIRREREEIEKHTDGTQYEYTGMKKRSSTDSVFYIS